MQCESCNEYITPKMKGALKSNICPFCNEQIMNPLKAEQYFNLVELLDLTDFTNRKDVDVQIRTKVANLMLENFVFKKLDTPQKQSDLIVLDEKAHVVSDHTPTFSTTLATNAELKQQLTQNNSKQTNAKDSNSSPETLSSTTTQVESPTQVGSPRSLKANKNKNKQKTKLPSLYQSLEQQVDSEEDSFDDSGLTPEELKKFFPSLTDQDLSDMLDRTKESKKTQEGSGIRRLNK